MRTELVIRVVALILAASAIPMARGQSPNGELKALSIDELKSAFLSCNRAASSGRLDTAAIMHCSVVYEELKQRAFGGDFGKLLDWSKAQPSGADTVRRAGAPVRGSD